MFVFVAACAAANAAYVGSYAGYNQLGAGYSDEGQGHGDYYVRTIIHHFLLLAVEFLSMQNSGYHPNICFYKALRLFFALKIERVSATTDTQDINL